MPARKISNMYYNDGTTARKILPKEETKRKVNTAVRRNNSNQNSIKRQQEQWKEMPS